MSSKKKSPSEGKKLQSAQSQFNIIASDNPVDVCHNVAKILRFVHFASFDLFEDDEEVVEGRNLIIEVAADALEAFGAAEGARRHADVNRMRHTIEVIESARMRNHFAALKRKPKAAATHEARIDAEAEEAINRTENRMNNAIDLNSTNIN